MKRLVTICTLLAAVAIPLSASVKFTSTWKSPDAGSVSFAGKKVAALVISKDESLRMSGEEALVSELTARGLKGWRPIASHPKRSSEVRRSGEGLGRQSERRRRGRDPTGERGKRQSYTPGTWMNLYYSTFTGYYGYGWGSVYMPGSVSENGRRRGEHDLQRAPKRALWAAVSETTNPKNLSSSSEPREGIRQGTTETGARREPAEVVWSSLQSIAREVLPEDSADSENHPPAAVEPDARAEQHGADERVDNQADGDVRVQIGVLVAVERRAVLEPGAEEHRTAKKVGQPAHPAHRAERENRVVIAPLCRC